MARPQTLSAKVRRRLRWYGRLATSPWRPLPDFIIIGAQKGGTSALNAYLKQHIYVRRSMKKEVHYYDRRFHKSVMWYRAHFPLRREIPEGGVTGEASPYYLAHPHVPKRIATVQPDVKMIALLRDPKKRALSHYHMSVRKGRESFSFDEAIRKEEERIGDDWQRTLEQDGYESVPLRYYSYKLRGHYAEQLKRYLEYFDRNQLLVLPSEWLRDYTNSTLTRICSFLDIPSFPEQFDARPRGVGTYKRELVPETEAYLTEYFRPLNEELYKLLGEDFGW